MSKGGEELSGEDRQPCTGCVHSIPLVCQLDLCELETSYLGESHNGATVLKFSARK